MITKIALCCIAKLENRYIREFVGYYLKLGFDHIYIYDNNDTGGEDITKTIGDFIYYKFVTIIDYKDKKNCQMQAYQECYENYGGYYDWMAFYDIDEYLEFTKFKNIKDFLNQDMFKDTQSIHINWLMFTDSEKIHYENKPLNKRFKDVIIPLDFFYGKEYNSNHHIKTILRTRMQHLEWGIDPHYLVKNQLICKNAEGEQVCSCYSIVKDPKFSVAFINHFIYKTIEEYIDIKMKRGWCDCNYDKAKDNLNIDLFFKFNNWTQEKQDYIDKRLGKAE